MSYRNRLYLKGLWLRKGYSFLWAHKPLCESFQEDVLKIGTVFLCRSCFFTYLGIISVAAISWFGTEFDQEIGRAVVLVLLSVVLPLSYPTLYKKMPRIVRDLLRFGMGAIIVVSVSILLIGDLLFALPLCLLLGLFWWFYFKKRAKRKLTACNVCDEYSDNTICSGYATQATLIREYEDEATEYLISSGHVPVIKKQ